MTPQACYDLIKDALKRGRVGLAFDREQLPPGFPLETLGFGPVTGWTVSAYLPADAPGPRTLVTHFHMPRHGGRTRITHEALR